MDRVRLGCVDSMLPNDDVPAFWVPAMISAGKIDICISTIFPSGSVQLYMPWRSFSDNNFASISVVFGFCCMPCNIEALSKVIKSDDGSWTDWLCCVFKAFSILLAGCCAIDSIRTNLLWSRARWCCRTFADSSLQKIRKPCNDSNALTVISMPVRLGIMVLWTRNSEHACCTFRCHFSYSIGAAGKWLSENTL